MRPHRLSILLAGVFAIAGCTAGGDDKICVGLGCETDVKDPDESDPPVIDTEESDPPTESDPPDDTDTDPPVEETDETDVVDPETDVTETDHTDETDPEETDHTDETDPEETDHTDPPVVLDPVRPGDLAITEIHVDPAGCVPDAVGQYIELKNVRATPLSLDRIRLRLGTTEYALPATTVLQPGAYFVVTTSRYANAGACGYDLVNRVGDPARVAPSLGTAQLDRFGELIELIRRDTSQTFALIDEVDTSAIAVRGAGVVTWEGYAIHALTESALGNNLPSAWCLADVDLGGGNWGSPGQAAVSCGTPPVDPHTDETDTDTYAPETDPPDTDDSDFPSDPILPGELVVTEIMLKPTDCGLDQASGRWIELRNASDRWLDLRGVYLTWGRGVGGQPSTQKIPLRAATKGIAGDMLVAPGEYFTIQRETTTGTVCHGYGHQFALANALSLNGRLLRVMSLEDVEIDAVDFEGWNLPDGRAFGVKRAHSADAHANDLPESWCAQSSVIVGASADRGTPNLPNDTCEGPGDTGDDTDPHTDTDTDPPEPECPALDTRDTSDGLQVDELCEGDLIVTELMIAPQDCADRARWVEVYNNTPYDIHPQGIMVELFDGTTTGTSSVESIGATDAPIPPFSFAVIHEQLNGGDACHPVSASHQIASAAVQLVPGRLRLETGGGLIDEVDFTTWPIPAGYSLQFRPDIGKFHLNNDAAYTWCVGGPLLPGGPGVTDRGTPGAESDCELYEEPPDTGDTDPGIETDTDTDDHTDPRSETDDDPGDTAPLPPDTDDIVVPNPIDGLDAAELREGDLIISEVMWDPTDCGANGGAGRYVEVFNASGAVVRPAGVLLSFGTFRGAEVRALDGVGAIPPGGVAVIRARPNEPFCYDQVTPQPRFSAALEISRTPTFVRVYTEFPSGQFTIDRVDFRGWRSEAGVALQLPDAALTTRMGEAANDLEAAWCPSGPHIAGSEDRGSPGARGSCGTWPADDPDPTDTDPMAECGADLCLADLRGGDLIFTELMVDPKCNNRLGEYVEIWNATERSVNIKGVRMRYTTGATTREVEVTKDTILPASNGFAVLVSAQSNNPRCYVPAETAAASWTTNWNLAIGGTTPPVYTLYAITPDGEATLDQVNTASWPVPASSERGSSYQLNPDSFMVNGFPGNVANDDVANWCATPAATVYQISSISGGEFGTPGTPNGPCYGETGVQFEDTDTDTFDTVPVIEARTVEELAPGDLVITEFIPIPSECSPEVLAEYIEVYNATDERVNLNNLVIADDWHTFIRFNSYVEPGAYAVLVNASQGVRDRCYDIEPTALYGDAVGLSPLELANGGEVLALRRPDGVVIDSVDYRAWSPQIGHAWQLGTGTPDARLNDDPDNWCRGTTRIPGATRDYGTPGAAADCEVDVVDTDTDTTEDSDDPIVDHTDILERHELQPGDLIVTEFMVRTGEPGCGDVSTEWFEVRNTTSLPIDLKGVTIENQFSVNAVTILDGLLVGAGEHVAFARHHAPERCYDVDPRFVYPNLIFRQSGDVIRIRVGERVIDEVDFRMWGDLPAGRAMQLDRAAVAAGTNDDRFDWCPATAPIPGASVDRGTPGARNDVCVTTQPPVEPEPDDPSETDTDIYWPSPTDEEPPPPVDTDTRSVDDLVIGDLVITEIMATSADCNDGRGEYIEILNLTDDVIDLEGLLVRSASGSYRVGPMPHGIPAGGLALGVRADARPLCHGMGELADFTWTGVELAYTGVDAWVEIGNAGGTLDRVDYGAWPVALNGASWNLDPRSASPGFNDTFESWCASVDPIGPAPRDLGTPGFPNRACAGDGDSDVWVDTGDTDTQPPLDPDEVIPIGEVGIGELLISEFHPLARNCPAGKGQYVELYNNGDAPIDLNGLVIGNGSAWSTVVRRPLSLVIRPGEFMVASRGPDPCYTYAPDFTFAPAVGIGGGVVFIANGPPGELGTIIDLVRYDDFPADPGAAFMLKPERFTVPPTGGVGDLAGPGPYVATYANNFADAWCTAWELLPNATSDYGNPGVTSPRCLEAGEEPPLPGGVANLDQLDPGDLVITELMVDPTDCPDITGEYVEVYNATSHPVRLDGLRLLTGTGTFTFFTPMVLEPAEVALIRQAGGSLSCYPALIPDVIGNFSLPNDGSDVSIANGHSVLDTVPFERIGLRPGLAVALDPDHHDAFENDLASNWCFQDALVPGATADRGTPGQLNEPCVGTAEVRTIAEVTPGDLVINEILWYAADCTDGQDQYVEVLNVSASAIDLMGMFLQTDQGHTTIHHQVLVDPGDVAVLYHPRGCLSAQQVRADFVYQHPWINTVNGDHVRIGYDADHDFTLTPSEVLDGVPMPLSTWGDPGGRAWQLVLEAQNVVDNDDPASWCLADQRVRPRLEVRGTPGLENDCSPDTDLPPDHTDTAVVNMDTGFWTVAGIGGSATVIAPAYYSGTMERFIGVVPGRYWFRDDMTATFEPLCRWQWRSRAPSGGIANLASVCPECEFGFDVEYYQRTNIIGGGRPQSCGDTFDPYGGVGSATFTRRLMYSSTYDGTGALFWVDPSTGYVDIYTRDVSFNATEGKLNFNVLIYENKLP